MKNPMFLVLLMSVGVAVWIVGGNASDNVRDAMPLMSEGRFSEVRDTLKRIQYPVKRATFIEILGGEKSVRWIFDSTYGREQTVRHRSYFATEPHIPGAGSFCIEVELGKMGIEPTDEVMAARLCFVSRFGIIFYEEMRPENGVRAEWR